MAAELSMNGRKKIETIQKEFTNKFNYLTLLFLDENRKSLDISCSLAQVRTVVGADISINAGLKVNTLEVRFMQNYGLLVEVAYSKDGKVLHTKDSVDKTLNELNQWCEKNGCDKFIFKKALTKNTILSTQEKLFNAIKESFPDAEVKKINKDNFMDIHIPSIHPKRGTHLFFNTARNEIKLGFYVRDKDFISRVMESSSKIEQYSQGLRISGNPTFQNVEDAFEAAMEFIGEMIGHFAYNESESDLLVHDEDEENGPENMNKSIDEVLDDLKNFDPENMVYLSVNFQTKPLYERGKVGGSFNGKEFNIDYTRTWARGYLLSDEKMNIKKLIEIIENKSIEELTSSDFLGLEYGELHDYTIEYKNITLDNKEIPESIEPEDLFSKGEVIGDVIFEFDSFDDLSINVFSEEYEANIHNEKEELVLEDFTLIHTLVTVYSAFANQSGISDASLDVLLDRIKAWDLDLSQDGMKNEIMKTLRWFTKNYDASLFSKLKLKLNELSDLQENKRKTILDDLREISNTFFEMPSAKIQLYSSFITNLGFNKNDYAIVPVTTEMIEKFNNTFDIDCKSTVLENFQEEGYISLFSIDVRNLNKAIEENDFSADMLHHIGNVELEDWDSLEKLTNEDEVASIKKDFKDEKSKYIVIMYCQGNYIHAFSCPEYDE